MDAIPDIQRHVVSPKPPSIIDRLLWKGKKKGAHLEQEGQGVWRISECRVKKGRKAEILWVWDGGRRLSFSAKGGYKDTLKTWGLIYKGCGNGDGTCSRISHCPLWDFWKSSAEKGAHSYTSFHPCLDLRQSFFRDRNQQVFLISSIIVLMLCEPTIP